MPAFVVITLSIAAFLALPAIGMRIWRQFWIETEGQILSTRLGRATNADRKRIHTLNIQYSFIANGQRYSGTGVLHIDVPYYEEKDAIRRLTSDYAAGDRIRVYHASSSPQMSALQRSNGLDKILYGIGFLVLVALGYYLYFSLAFSSMKKA